jgi:hypothetical protein
MRILPAAGFCGIAGVLVHGMTDYVWYNYRVFLMFWLIIGLSCAWHKLDLRESKSSGENNLYHASLELDLHDLKSRPSADNDGNDE